MFYDNVIIFDYKKLVFELKNSLVRFLQCIVN